MLGDEWLQEVLPHVTHLPHVRIIQEDGANLQFFIDLLSRKFVDTQWKHVQIVLLTLGAIDLCETSSERVLLKYKALICMLRARLGDIQIVCCTLPPRLGLLFQTGLVFNKEIVKLANTLKADCFPLHRVFVCGKTARPDYYAGGIKLSTLGIKVVVKMIKQFKVKLYLY